MRWPSCANGRMELCPTRYDAAGEGSVPRHSTITLTMDRYSHTYRGEATAGLDLLPDLSVPAREIETMTGTDRGIPPDCEQSPNRLSPGLSLDGAVGKSLVQCGLQMATARITRKNRAKMRFPREKAKRPRSDSNR